MKVEKARISDAQQMHVLINSFANKGEMLPRALSDIYENLRDYYVIRDNDERVLACVALHISWADLAEVRSLAVDKETHFKGLGRMLVKECLQEADQLGIATVFCLTYKPDFFKKCGFEDIDKMELPRKVWSECFHCPKFPDCDEVALVYKFKQPA